MRRCTAKSFVLQLLLCVVSRVLSFTNSQFQCQEFQQRGHLCQWKERPSSMLQASPDHVLPDEVIAEQEEKFKIVTCMSTACSRKRRSLGMDDLSTFGAMYSRASDSRVKVEEGACMGSCKKGPCVSIEHEDFFGAVALEGMSADEFSSDAYVQARI